MEHIYHKGMVLRNIFHIFGTIFPLIYMLMDKEVVLFLVLLLTCIASVLELLRLKGYFRGFMWEKVLKEKEAKMPTGSFFFLLSCLVVIVVFEKKVAIASMFVLSLSDPIAAIFGRKLGRMWLGKKSVEGSFLFFLVTFFILYLVGEKTGKAIFVSIVVTIVEILSIKIDDNLTVPLSTAFALKYFNF